MIYTAKTDIFEGGFFWAKGEEVDISHPYFERIKDRCDVEGEAAGGGFQAATPRPSSSPSPSSATKKVVAK